MSIHVSVIDSEGFDVTEPWPLVAADLRVTADNGELAITTTWPIYLTVMRKSDGPFRFRIGRHVGRLALDATSLRKRGTVVLMPGRVTVTVSPINAWELV